MRETPDPTSTSLSPSSSKSISPSDAAIGTITPTSGVVSNQPIPNDVTQAPSITMISTPTLSSVHGTNATESPLPLIANRPTLRPNLFSQPKSFVQECKDTLLSPSTIEDGVLSQLEFADFLFGRCNDEGLCDDQSGMKFEQLDVKLQLDFILAACDGEMADCIDELGSFGFNTQDEGIETSIDELCSTLSVRLRQTVPPTSKPSTIDSGIATPTKTSTDGPSKKPSFSPSLQYDSNETYPPTEKKPLGPRKALVGISAVLVVLIITAGGVLAYRRSGYFTKKDTPADNYYSKEANYYGASTCEPWVRQMPFPFSISSSCSSSSSSFRDHRFVPVFTANGESIVQFDPNTANAVVIGSVYLGGGGSSSISTGPGCVGSKYDCITIGEVTERAKSESSGFSSVSSDHSSKARTRSYFFRRSRASKGASIDLASDSNSTSVLSRTTMPITQSKATKFERHAVHFDNAVSFADWKAASHVISEYRTCDVTDEAAALKQKQFFFDLFTSPHSDNSSASQRASVHSLDFGSMPGYDDYKATMVPWALNENSGEFKPSEVLVPWRRGGFSSVFQPSDGKQSEESESFRSVYVEHISEMLSPKQSSARPVHAVFKRAKSMMKGWFKYTKYQHLNEWIHEDPSVVSMRSYSSHIQLLPTSHQPSSPVFGMPGLLLGTWAAAAIPTEASRSSMLCSDEQDLKIGGNVDSAPSDELLESQAGQTATQSKPPVLGIEGRDDFESDPSGFASSSAGWSSASIKHSSFISSSSSATWDNSISVLVQNESLNLPADKGAINVSRATSEGESTRESSKVDEGRSFQANLYQIHSHTSPKYHDRNFFMMLANDFHNGASSVGQSTPRSDWSHNISDSTVSSESDSADSDEYQNSLSLSLES